MVNVCLYFDMNKNYMLNKFTVFDIGKNSEYFDSKIAEISKGFYIPLNRTILKLINNNLNFKVSYSISGSTLEQLEKHSPEAIQTLKDLAETGNVEFLSQTYCDSLAYFYSKKEFKEQIRLNDKKIMELFNIKPKVFATNLKLTKELTKVIDSLGYKAIIGTDKRNDQNFIYKIKDSDAKILLKNGDLTNRLNLGFLDHKWKEWPVTLEGFSNLINQNNNDNHCVNLFLNLEAFSKNHTRFLSFFGNFPKKILENQANDFKTPSDIVKVYKPKNNIKLVKDFELSYLSLNKMQKESLKKLYDLEKLVEKTKNPDLVLAWRKLQSSKNIHFMTTKIKENNPYETPYDAFINHMNILNDIELRLNAAIKPVAKKTKTVKIIRFKAKNEKINKEQIKDIKPESVANIIGRLKEVYKVE